MSHTLDSNGHAGLRARTYIFETRTRQHRHTLTLIHTQTYTADTDILMYTAHTQTHAPRGRTHARTVYRGASSYYSGNTQAIRVFRAVSPFPRSSNGTGTATLSPADGQI